MLRIRSAGGAPAAIPRQIFNLDDEGDREPQKRWDTTGSREFQPPQMCKGKQRQREKKKRVWVLGERETIKREDFVL